MTDVHDGNIRSFNMSQIKSKNTKPEMLVRSFLHSNGLRYKLHESNLPGKPDIVLPKYSTVIFVNGCFWHGHKGCKYFKLPKTRADWWKEKINTNSKRDSTNYEKLTKMNYKVIVIWECEIKNKSIFSSLLKNVKNEKG